MPSVSGNLATNKLTLQAHGPVDTGNLVMEVSNSAFTMSMGSNVLMTVAPDGVDDIVGSSSNTSSTLTINRDTIIDGTLAVVDAFKVDVKDTTVNVTNSMYADMLATTQSGRIALAKALNFGTSKGVFDANGFTPLLESGYSGKGVQFGHFEAPLHFDVPPLRHIVNPGRIIPLTSLNTLVAANMCPSSINPDDVQGINGPHKYFTITTSVGFDLHAKTTASRYRQIPFDGWTLENEDNFVMGAAYNANVVHIDKGINNAAKSAVYTDLPDLTDDMVVEGFQMAFNTGVKVSTTSLLVAAAGYNGYYYNVDHSGNDLTGISNPISYVASLAADNDMVHCVSAGNSGIPGGGYLDVAASTGNLGTGVMLLTETDGRNILTCGSKLLDSDWAVIKSFNSGALHDYVSYDNYINTKDFGQVNYYKKPGENKWSSTPKTGYTDRQLKPIHCFGTTSDTAGPGATHRVKPEIISSHGAGERVAWPQLDGRIVDCTSWVYTAAGWTGTSGAAPMIAAGVVLLREALPMYDAHQIRECILLSASNKNLSDADTNVGLGYGVINLEAALAYGRARPKKAPPSFKKGSWTYGSAFLASITAGALDTLNNYQPYNGGNDFTPKSVQSFKCPKDASLSADAGYQTAYAAYETAYNTYVASAPHLWTAGALDLSPAQGLWMPNIIGVRDISVDGTPVAPALEAKSNRCWLSVATEDMQEIKDLMVANNIKVMVTSLALGAFSVLAESPEQLTSVINGNTKIRHITPVQKLKRIEQPLDIPL